MLVDSKTRIRSSAREVLAKLWRMRDQIWNTPPSAEGLIPVPVDVIARSVLGVKIEEPEEIPSDREGFETAGFMDRLGQRIVIAQKHKLEYRRFTMAHEVGHWVIHPDVSYHRDRPLNGGERANPHRDLEEQEADAFASELLMPSKPLVQCFNRAFGNKIDGRTPDPRLAFWLSVGTGRKVSDVELCSSLRRRSLLVAATTSFGSEKHFVSLAAKFEVTVTAMAIQLEDIGLVI